MRNFVYSFLASIVALFTAMNALAADKPSAAQPSLSYLHLYSDSAGNSHFKEGQMPFTKLPVGPAGYTVKDTTARFAHLKAGTWEDWHTTGQRVLLIVIKGMTEVTASDGQVRRLTPGSVTLMDDTTGKGHTTRVIGHEDHVALAIPASEVPGAK